MITSASLAIPPFWEKIRDLYASGGIDGGHFK